MSAFGRRELQDMVSTPVRRELDMPLGPYHLEPVSAPLGLGPNFARYCSGEGAGEQTPHSTPKQAAARPLRVEQAISNSAPPAVRDEVFARSSGDHVSGEQLHRTNLDTRLGDLSMMLDTIAAIRDGSVAESSTVDTPLQVCTLCFRVDQLKRLSSLALEISALATGAWCLQTTVQ